MSDATRHPKGVTVGFATRWSGSPGCGTAHVTTAPPVNGVIVVDLGVKEQSTDLVSIEKDLHWGTSGCHYGTDREHVFVTGPRIRLSFDMWETVGKGPRHWEMSDVI